MVIMMLQLKLLLNLIVIRSITIAAAQSLPGCPDRCGNVTIPYPFGTVEGCYLSKSYYVNCETLQIANTSFKLESISLDGHMRGSLPIAYRCYNKHHGLTSKSEPRIDLSTFHVSVEENLLTVVGCDARADIKAIEGEDYITGCITRTNCNMLTNFSCLGMGCSKVPVPNKLKKFRIHAQSNLNQTVGRWRFNKCVYAFLVERDRYTFQETDFDSMKNRSFPVVLDWSVGNTTCENAQKDAGKDYASNLNHGFVEECPTSDKI